MRRVGQKQNVATKSRYHPQDHGRIDQPQETPRTDPPHDALLQGTPGESQRRQRIVIGLPPYDECPVCGELRQKLEE